MKRILNFAILVFILCSCESAPDQRFTNYSNTQLQKEINDYTRIGYLKKIEAGNFFYVDPIIWDGSNVDIKKMTAMVFADYANSKGESCWCEIYDYQSGKKLAKLGAWGFSIE